MGRLPKKGIDYFTHDVNASMMPTLYTIQQSYGNDGYAFWFKLLEYLGTQENLSADFSDKKYWLYFISIANVSKEKGEEIMSLLASIGAIDEKLWGEHRIVWSENFAERAAAVYVKRGNPAPRKPTPAGECRIPESNDGFPEEQQSKFKKPTVEQIADYCSERKNSIDPQNFYDFYESKGWKVGNQAMKDWKACVRTWESREGGKASRSSAEPPSKYDREE